MRLESVRFTVRFSSGIPKNAAVCFLCPSMTKTGTFLCVDTALQCF